MKFPIGSLVQVVDDPDVFYCGARGKVASFNPILDEYLVHFIAIDVDDGEEFVYEECFYHEDELILVKEGLK